MASIARLDAQLHSTAAHRYSKGAAADCRALKSPTRRRCCRRPCFDHKSLLEGGIPQLSAQCCVGATSSMGGVVIRLICSARMRRAQPNELDERACNCDARSSAADAASFAPGTRLFLSTAVTSCCSVCLTLAHALSSAVAEESRTQAQITLSHARATLLPCDFSLDTSVFYQLQLWMVSKTAILLNKGGLDCFQNPCSACRTGNVQFFRR